MERGSRMSLLKATILSSHDGHEKRERATLVRAMADGK
jgi:hypothetical protein